MRLARSSTRPAWTVLVLMAGLVASVGVARSAAYSSTVIAATSAGSIVAIFVGIRWHHPPARRFWRLTTAALLAGILAGGLGTVYADSLLWTVAIDLTFVVGYLLFVAAGLLLLPKGRGRHDWASTLDATTLGIAGALAFWYFVISPRLAEDMSFHVVTTGIVFPVLDLLLLVVASRLATSSTRNSFAFLVMVTAFAASIISDFSYALTSITGTYAWGSPRDMLWIVPSACIGIAALHPSMATLGLGRERALPKVTWPRVFLVGVGSVAAPLIVAGTALNAGRLHEEWPALLIGSTLLSLAGIARAAEMVREQRVRAEELQSVAARLQSALAQSRQLQEELRQTALRDPLTGLANRRLFQQRLAQALVSHGSSCAVMFIDIDDFRNINDSLGHATGDQVLIELAGRLQQGVRPSDIVVRLGGDEFAVLLRDADHATATAVGQRLIAAMARPIDSDGHLLHTSASIGVTTAAPGDTEPDVTRNADIALYAAKADGKNRLAWFQEHMRHSVVDRVQLQNDLWDAVHHGQVTVAYQPVVDLASGRIEGVEALARWHHPVRGAVPPSTFIPLAESSGLIATLGGQVLLEAAKQLRRWTDRGFELSMAVNVSPIQLSDPGFVGDVTAATELIGDRSRLVLELTESALVGDAAHVQLLAHLRHLGCRIAIDDFGTGFSSLAYLRRLPIDIVKIDRSFLEDLHRGPEAASLVKAILGLGETFGYSVIAEGIERADTAASLQRYGCPYGQGYLFGAPMPPAGIEQLLSAAALPA